MTAAPQTMAFTRESDAVDFVVESLSPFCTRIVREPELKNGMRPDIGLRLRALPDVSLAIECKQFDGEAQLRGLTDGIAQASQYAAQMHFQGMKGVSFIAPFSARGALAFHTDSRVAGAMLVAGQLSVGALAFSGTARGKVATFVIGGQAAATLTYDDHGAPSCRLHTNAPQLLTYKNRWGSTTWRKPE